MKFSFFISKKQILHKLEIGYILLWVLKGNKIPSKVLHKEFWTKAMNIFNRCILPSPQYKKFFYIPHATISYTETMCIWENALHLIL